MISAGQAYKKTPQNLAEQVTGVLLFLSLTSGSDCYYVFLCLLRHNTDSYSSCKNINIGEGYDRLLACLIVAEHCENVGIAVLDCADVSDDPLTASVRLADDALADKLLEFCFAHFQIRTDYHKYFLHQEIHVVKCFSNLTAILRKYIQHAPMLTFP